MRFREIKLETHLLDEQREFYENTLGFKITAKRKHNFSLAAGKTILTFTRVREEIEPFYHFAFNIPSAQFESCKEWLKAKTSLLEEDGENVFHFENWNAKAIYFKDPAGNIVEFIARHNLPAGASAAFTPNNIQNISEVGIPVEDVGLFCREVRQAMRLPLFDGNEKDFAALGDEYGLFIVVPVNRNWFPTKDSAGPFQPIVELA
ncbi:MAG: VOC family protein [Calditrichota bacterium]